MKNLKRNAAIASTAAILAAIGIGGNVAAHASTPSPSHSVEQSDSDGETNDATEVEDANEINDGPDEGNQGPDANPNEPGHQDADETGESK